MPDSDPGGGLPAELAMLVQRWHPAGMALMTALDGEATTDEVRLIGPDDANTSLLRAELARMQPRIELTDPKPELRYARSGVRGTPRGAVSLPPAEAVDGAVETSTESETAPAVALVLLDAGAVLGTGTLRMVRGLRADGTEVLLAMNAIHAYQDWRKVYDRDQAFLAEGGVGDLEIMPVSARLAVAARATEDTALFDRSGLASLHAKLAAAAARAPDSGDRRSEAVTGRILTETRERIAEQMAIIRSGAQLTQLREERAKLLGDRDGGRAARLGTLRGQVNLTRGALSTEVAARVRALHTAARAELDRLPPREFADYPQRLRRAVSDLTATTDADIATRGVELFARFSEERHGDHAGEPEFASAEMPQLGPDPGPRQRGMEDHLTVALGASAGVGLGRMLVSSLTVIPALDVASVPITLLLGAGLALWVVRIRGQIADRNHLRRWAADAVVNVKGQLEQRVAAAMVQVETDLAEHVVRASTARIVEVDRRIAELAALIRRHTTEQPEQLSACERDIARIDRWLSAAP